jgi:heptosyltransferase-3
VRDTRGRILVIRGGAIGDFILTLPALMALRRQFPKAHLEVLGYPHIAQLAQAGGVVDRVQPIESRGLAGFFARGGNLDAATAGYFAGFNIIISYLYDPDDIFKTNVALCTRAQFIQGPHRPDESEGIHATQVFLKPLERLAIFAADPVPRLPINHQPSAINFLALHPGSGSEKKNWPEDNWATLLKRLTAEVAANLVLVGGEAEGERLERLAKSLPSGRIQIARSLPLTDLAVRLSGCAAFVGHDSGISHLAAALGLPTLVLWGNTVEEVWRPQGEQVAVVREAGGLEALSVARVLRELTRVLPGFAE